MRYTTPKGNVVGHKGVGPDLPFDDGRPTPDASFAEWTLRGTGAVQKYRHDHWDATLKQLADVDRFETSSYKGFDAFYGRLQNDLRRDQVHEEGRRSPRRPMEHEG